MAKQVLLEPKDAALGRDLLMLYIGCKKNPSEGLGRLMTGNKRKDYNTLAQEVYQYDSYRAMPKDCKAFVSRCASRKKDHPSWTFEQTINHEYMKICQQAERLYEAVKACTEDYYRRVVYPEVILPRMEAEWYIWAEKNPSLAFIED